MANVICCALSPSCSVGKHVTWAMTRVEGRECAVEAVFNDFKCYGYFLNVLMRQAFIANTPLQSRTRLATLTGVP